MEDQCEYDDPSSCPNQWCCSEWKVLSHKPGSMLELGDKKSFRRCGSDFVTEFTNKVDSFTIMLLQRKLWNNPFKSIRQMAIEEEGLKADADFDDYIMAMIKNRGDREGVNNYLNTRFKAECKTKGHPLNTKEKSEDL